MQKELYKFIKSSKCFAIVCSHTDNVPAFVDTFHKFIKSYHSQSITTASHAVTQSQHISIYLQLITSKIIHNTHNQYDTTDYNTKYKLLCPRGTQTCALAVANITGVLRPPNRKRVCRAFRLF